MKHHLTHEQIARIAAAANSAYQRALGEDPTQATSIEVVTAGVKAIADGKITHARASHENWLNDMRSKGFQYGPVKDVEAKTHPCFVPYDELPPEQQVKDALFFAIVTTLLNTRSNFGSLLTG
jgi:hypothetical protein